ncbi:MAG: hypothetical protein GX086_05900 [Alcaligenaceae bacterium]|nr:hypothetical protein [Alcaligenaceae bacterium]
MTHPSLPANTTFSGLDEAEVIEIIGEIMGDGRASAAVATKHSAAWIKFANAVIARYGNAQPANPAVKDSLTVEPLKYGGPDSDDYVTGWNDAIRAFGFKQRDAG